MRRWQQFSLVCVMACIGVPAWSADGVDAEGSSDRSVATPPQADAGSTAKVDAPAAENASLADQEVVEEQPWDYSPYQVLVWLVSDDPSIDAKSIEKRLRLYLDRDFSAVWRVKIEDAPRSVQSAARRQMDALSYDSITASDPVLAVKRNHPDAVRLRIAKNVGEFVSKVYSTSGRIDDVLRRATAAGDETLAGVAQRLEAVDGDAVAVSKLWADEATEAVLVSRGMATTLTEPEAKLITPRIEGLVGQAVESFDKVFVVRVGSDAVPTQIDVVEFDSLMRHFGPVATVYASNRSALADTIGQGLAKAFAPVVRIENAGQRNAVGLLRAGGLIVDENSPAGIRVNDILEPMTRKNDRNGKPILIGAIDWAFLLVTELEDRNIKMDYYAGRAGGLQGRKNKRTFRMALKVRPYGDSSMLRLHLRGDPNFPLIGYELYEKELKSTKMTFIGRTDWNGRLNIQRSDDPFRLLYVKNGGAVLARLPIVPGLKPFEVADLAGDDMRLQAEAYIRGVQNSIIDLVAIRELFKARIRMRLERGEMEKADTLMNALREQPDNSELAGDLTRKQADFNKAIGTRNASQLRKVDEMFANTRELLTKHINPRLLRDLEKDLLTARNNGGRLPKQQAPQEEAGEEAPADAGS